MLCYNSRSHGGMKPVQSTQPPVARSDCALINVGKLPWMKALLCFVKYRDRDVLASPVESMMIINRVLCMAKILTNAIQSFS